MRRMILMCAVLALAACEAYAQGEGEASTLRSDHVVVRYSGVGENYAKALARVAEDARAAAEKDFGFDMPDTILLEVDKGGETRLFNDGDRAISLTVRSEADLRQPAKSGVFNIYGICHEIAHMAMYRVIKDHNWMTNAAAEGWPHYMGSRLVDAVYKAEGEGLWPDRYNYLADGTQRLKANLATATDRVTKGAALWMELVDVVGDKSIVQVFKAWGAATIDPADPGAALRKALLSVKNDPKLSDWWNKAEVLFVQARPKSDFAATVVDRKDLTGKSKELALDDGVSAGKSSIAGGGHAVCLQAPSASSVLVGVKIYGSRYGYPAPPKEDFHVWLCDESFKTVADFAFPYSSVDRSEPKWVTLSVPPTKVPEKFIVCVGFNPTQTKGVFLHYDKAAASKDGKVSSFIGLPGAAGEPFTKGDWMIRAVLDTIKGGDPLRPGQ